MKKENAKSEFAGHAYLFTGSYADWRERLHEFVAQFDASDVHVFERGGGAAWKIAEVRQIASWASLRPYAGTRKLAVLDEIERFTPEASDAFLKTLEEPPESALFFLFTRFPWAVKPTIRSRMVMMGDSIGALPPEPTPESVKEVQKLLTLPMGGRLNAAQAFAAEGEDVEAHLTSWALVFRSALLGETTLKGIDGPRALGVLQKILQSLGTLRQTPVQARLLIDSIILSW